MRQIHPDLVAKAQKEILSHEASLTEEQKALWGEVYQLVGPEDVFLLAGLMKYILRGKQRRFLLHCIPETNYALPLGE